MFAVKSVVILELLCSSQPVCLNEMRSPFKIMRFRIRMIWLSMQNTGAHHGSARQNICSDGDISWLENRADISRADNMSLILFSFIVLYHVYRDRK